MVLQTMTKVNVSHTIPSPISDIHRILFTLVPRQASPIISDDAVVPLSVGPSRRRRVMNSFPEVMMSEKICSGETPTVFQVNEV